MNRFLVCSFLLFPLAACYFNPIVNGILAPAEKATNSSLGLLALGGGPVSEIPPVATAVSTDATLQVEGQIKNTNGSNIVNPVLSISSSSSVREAVSSSTNANANGRFLLKLRQGIFVFNVVSSSGTKLGTLTITISASNTTTTELSSGAQFRVSSLIVHDINASVNLTETEIVSPTVSSTNPSNGTTNFSMTFNSSEGYYDTFVTINFSEDLTQSTLTTNNITITPSATLSLSPSSNSVAITIQNSTANTLYTISLGNGILDLAGNGLVSYSFNFTTNAP